MTKDFFRGKNIYLPRIDSTNKELIRMLKEKSLPEGTVLWTDEQYKGRGMGNNSWITESGLNITASFLFYPDFILPEKQFYINKIVSLAVCDTVSNLLGQSFIIKIKWPNDIMVNNKKISGILTESTIQGSKIEYSISGIGINVNQTSFADYPHTPTSLKLITGKDYDISFCLEKLSLKLRHYYEMLRNGLFSHIDKEYINSLFQFGEDASYKKGGKTFTAIITGVNKYGLLQLQHSDGNIESYDFKEVSFC